MTAGKTVAISSRVNILIFKPSLLAGNIKQPAIARYGE